MHVIFLRTRKDGMKTVAIQNKHMQCKPMEQPTPERKELCHMKKLVSIVLALLIVLLLLPDINQAQAATYSDIGGHWAKDAIMRWSDCRCVI